MDFDFTTILRKIKIIFKLFVIQTFNYLSICHSEEDHDQFYVF